MDTSEEKSGKGDPDSYVNLITEEPSKVVENAESSEEDLIIFHIEKTLLDAGKNVLETAQDMEDMATVDMDAYGVPDSYVNLTIKEPTKVVENAESSEEDLIIFHIEKTLLDAGKNVLETAQDMEDMATVDMDAYGVPDSYVNLTIKEPTKVVENAESSEEDLIILHVEKTLVDAGKNVLETAQDMEDMATVDVDAYGVPDSYVNLTKKEPTKVVENAESSEEDLIIFHIEKTLLDAGKNVLETAQDMEDMATVDVDAYGVPDSYVNLTTKEPTKVVENAESSEEDLVILHVEKTLVDAGKNVLETAQDVEDMATVDVDAYGVPPVSPEELANMILPPENSARVTEMNINPLTLELMSMCLAKNVLYTPVKNLVSKYPEWLETHKPTLSATEYNKRVEQFELLKIMCSEYEKEETNESEDVKTERLKILMELMYKVRCCGDPFTQL